MKIKIKLKHDFCMPQKHGDWYDLCCAEDVELSCPIADTLRRHNKEKVRVVSFDKRLIDLGVAMQLPKGYEAIVVPRSSTFNRYKVLQTNSMGVIDNAYCGDRDWWKFPVVALGQVKIDKQDRLCQFRIQLNQDATTWQKIKWIFSKRVKFEVVEHLDSPDRGGFGHSGK